MTAADKLAAAKKAYFGMFKGEGPFTASEQIKLELRRAEMIAAYDAVQSRRSR